MQVHDTNDSDLIFEGYEDELINKDNKLEEAITYDFTAYDSPVATTQLYDSTHVTVLQAIVQYLYWFTEHPSMSKEALSSLLHFHHHFILPPNNLLPDS